MRQSRLPSEIELAGRAVPLSCRRSRRARRLTLRVDPKHEVISLTAPQGLATREVLAFLDSHRDWLEERVQALPPRTPFAVGSLLPILDNPHRIALADGARRGVWLTPGRLWVSGRTEHHSRRIEDFLRVEARRSLSATAREKAAGLPRRANRLRGVSVRDTRSRWGSCTATGQLNFSWRLLLAPEAAFDYVVAHEVAHLAYPDHSPNFWALCEDLSDDMESGRDWLRQRGSQLFRYGG